ENVVVLDGEVGQYSNVRGDARTPPVVVAPVDDVGAGAGVPDAVIFYRHLVHRRIDVAVDVNAARAVGPLTGRVRKKAGVLVAFDGDVGNGSIADTQQSLILHPQIGNRRRGRARRAQVQGVVE